MRKMISLRLTSLILVGFLLLHALKNSSAHAHQAKAKIIISRKNHAFAIKEIGNSNPIAKATLGGRKMVSTHNGQKFDDQKGMNNPNAALSGIDKERNVLKTPNSMVSHDVSLNKVEIKAFSNSRNSKSTLSNSIKEKITQDYESKARKNNESNRLLEASREIMKLMDRDYGGRKPPIKRRSPINNHNTKH
ncbi:unnamed protein product [Amaranthus hypochondriacus]